MLEERGLVESVTPPSPDVFVVCGGDDAAVEAMPRILGELRRAGFHARRSYRSTRNVGKLLGEAAKSGARSAVILGREFEAGEVTIKDLESGEQRTAAIADLVESLGGNKEQS